MPTPSCPSATGWVPAGHFGRAPKSHHNLTLQDVLLKSSPPHTTQKLCAMASSSGGGAPQAERSSPTLEQIIGEALAKAAQIILSARIYESTRKAQTGARRKAWVRAQPRANLVQRASAPGAPPGCPPSAESTAACPPPPPAVQPGGGGRGERLQGAGPLAPRPGAAAGGGGARGRRARGGGRAGAVRPGQEGLL